MKKNRFIISLFLAFLYVGSAKAQAPSFVFFSENALRCQGRVDLVIHACTASITDPYIVNSVDWNLGDGFTVTTSSLNYTYTYATSGIKYITGVVHCTMNGTAYAVDVIGYGSTTTQSGVGFLGFSPDEVCAHTNLTYQYAVNVYLGSISLFIESPTQPSVIYPYIPVDVSANYSQMLGLPSSFTYSGAVDGVTVISGSGSMAPSSILTNYYFDPGQHQVELTCTDERTGQFQTTDSMHYCTVSSTLLIEVIDPPESLGSCSDCFTFRPDRTKRYWISAWVKEEVISQVKTYTNTSLKVKFLNNTTPISTTTLSPTGEIIDGWQRIAGEFTVPANTTSIDVKLDNLGAVAAYFDDIRIHPFNASMKSYVYDAETFWLLAELDDNNYATFYEYDKEGQLIRIKKETAKGIMTIQESRSSNPKN